MCIKYVYYNKYDDNECDITEDLKYCTSNYICPEPRIIKLDRHNTLPRDQARAWPGEFHSVPDSSSESACDSSSSSPTSSPTLDSIASDDSFSYRHSRKTRERRPRSFSNDSGTRVSSPNYSASSPRPTSPYSPRTMPIPISRSPNMGYGGSTLPSERDRRPIIVDHRYSPAHSPANYTPRVMPSSLHTPADIYSHSTRRDLRDFRGVRDLREPPEIRLSREMSARDAGNTRYYHTLRDARPVAYSMPTSFGRSSYPRSPDYYRSPERVRASRSPRDYAYPVYAPVRRRREHDRPIVLPSSMPVLGSTGVYGTSYESNASGDAFSPANATVASSAAPNSPFPVTNGKKKIRWKDEERRKQNEKINSRPVLPRDPSEPADSSRSQGRLKSILKRPTSSTNVRDRSRGSSQASPHSYSRYAPSPTASPAANYHDEDLVTRDLSGLNLSSSPGTSSRRYDDPGRYAR